MRSTSTAQYLADFRNKGNRIKEGELLMYSTLTDVMAELKNMKNDIDEEMKERENKMNLVI